MGLMVAGGNNEEEKGSVITTSFIHTKGWDMSKWFLEVNLSFFTKSEVYNTYNFSTTALRTFTLQFDKVANYGVQYSTIYPMDDTSNKWKIVAGGTYTFEKDRTYVFGYGFTQSGNGYGVAVGKLI